MPAAGGSAGRQWDLETIGRSTITELAGFPASGGRLSAHRGRTTYSRSS